jgi:acyl-CoA synthetase (AMP-forming)/AMP-acid ligase II
MNLPSLRYLTQAGGKLSPELSAEFAEICARKGVKFIVMYGQTEATARMSYLPWEFARSKAGSIGMAIPGGAFSLRGDDGEDIKTPMAVGELIYSGENVTHGYAENRFDLARGDDRGGVLETGDMAYFDEDGFYFIAGRKKRFLKLFGNRINLDDVDAILKKEGFDCASTGIDDHLKIFITDKGKSREVSAFISGRIGIHPSGVRVIEVDIIPRSESGKVLYSDLGV